MPRVDGALGAPPMGSDAGRIPATVEAYLTSANLDALAGPEGGLLPHEAAALEALHAAAERCAPPLKTGAQLLEELGRSEMLSTGCSVIDEHLLQGGMRRGQMLEVCGETATGKTQLCIAAAAQAARLGLRAVYVDTSNALRGRRLAAVVEAQRQEQQAAVAADPLRFVEVRRCYTVHSLLATLDALMSEQAAHSQRRGAAQPHGGQRQGPGQQQRPQDAQQAQQPGPQAHQAQQLAAGDATAAAAGAAAAAAPSGVLRLQREQVPVSLLVVDSLSALISPVLGGGQHSQGHALLAAVATSLKAFAASSDSVVLVTNHMVGGSDELRHDKRPAMGESWLNQPHTRIQLHKPLPGAADPHCCTATLRASAAQPLGASVPFYLTAAGLSSRLDALDGQLAQGGGVRPQPMQH